MHIVKSKWRWTIEEKKISTDASSQLTLWKCSGVDRYRSNNYAYEKQ